MGERPYIMVTVLTYLIQFSHDEINCTTKIHSGNTALYYSTILPIRFLTDADNASDLTPYLHKHKERITIFQWSKAVFQG